MLGYFVADGKASTDFGVFLTDGGVYGIAEKDVEIVSVVGRNGDLIIDNGRYKNKKFKYPAFIFENFDTNFSALTNYLITRKGYFKLQDSFHPEYYVEARYSGGTDPKKVIDSGQKGKFQLEFDRKPQKYLTEGDYPIEITSNTTLLSNYEQVAKPMIRAYGTGRFTIGGRTIEITDADIYTDIDCDMQEAYKDTLSDSKNGNIVVGDFPVLVHGENEIELDGITKLELKPRWWIL